MAVLSDGGEQHNSARMPLRGDCAAGHVMHRSKRDGFEHYNLDQGQALDCFHSWWRLCLLRRKGRYESRGGGEGGGEISWKLEDTAGGIPSPTHHPIRE